MLRDYQQSAFNAVIEYLKTGKNNCLLEAATGAGKSHIIAALADFIYTRSGNQTICIAPSAELVKQNHGKYIADGNNASIYSASAGSKCLRYPVTFATPVTLKNNLNRFKSKVSAIIVDEVHGITPTIKEIINYFKSVNSRLKVIGLTATPYRLKTGYIFYKWPDDTENPLDKSKDPYFEKLVYRITAPELINMGYLTRPVFDSTIDHYESKNISLNPMGKFDAREIERAFEGKGRLTSNIIADIVTRAKDRKGVLIFCATVRHAYEALESLPSGISEIVHGKTPKKDRDRILSLFKQKKIKYIVNVAVLTTGFDAPHVDLIAVLRPTESVGLYQQIIGRGLRIDDNKDDCLILDYAENMDRHCPGDGDIFNMEISVKESESTGERIDVLCPICNNVNQFVFNYEYSDSNFNEYGHMVDLSGMEVTDDKGDPIAVHYGRACQFRDANLVRCPQKYNSKICPACGHDNDITARYCKECKEELIDPNEKLKLDFKKFKSDPYQIQTDNVIDFNAKNSISQKGNDVLKIDWITEYRKFTTYHSPLHKYKWNKFFTGEDVSYTAKFLNEYKLKGKLRTVTYQKKSSGFYEIYGFNKEADKL